MSFQTMMAGDLAYASRAEGGATKGHLVWDFLDPEDEDQERVLETIEADGVIGPVRTSKRTDVEVGEFTEADTVWVGPAAPFATRGLPPPDTTVTVNDVAFFVLDSLPDTAGAGVRIGLKRVE